jgi:UDP-2-acetamido-3-amino-2,3-dideoxy-glucuronate N-acetyltransferase
MKRKWLKGIIADVHPTVKIGKGTVVWSFAVIREDVIIGDNCVIGSGAYIGRHCRIGNNVRIQDKAHITERMVIEDNVFIGQGVVTIDDRYPEVNNPEYEFQPPYFEKGCSIGANATILPGVRIGCGALIGAGTVITKDVSPDTVIYGVSEKIRRRR